MRYEDIDAFAYGLARLFHTPIDQLRAERDAHQAREGGTMHPHVGAQSSYPEVASRTLMATYQQNPSPVYGYLRTQSNQKIYLFPSLDQAQAWFAGLRGQAAEPYDYAAVFEAVHLAAPVSGLESFGHAVVSGEAEVGSWLPFMLGLPAGALAGYGYRKWQEAHPGKIIPWISGAVGQPRGSGWVIHGMEDATPAEEQAFDVLQRRALRAGWDALGRQAPAAGPGWLYTTNADLTTETLHLMDSDAPWTPPHGVGFWAMMSLGASSPMLVDSGIIRSSRHFLATSPLIADQLAFESSRVVVHGVGATYDPDAARKRGFPQTKVLIQSAMQEVAEVANTYPAAAYVWVLSAASASSSPNITLHGTTEVVPFGSYEQALDYSREKRQYPDYVAVAVFDRANPHWPHPVAWAKSDNPEYASTIADHVARFAHPRMAGVVNADPVWNQSREVLRERGERTAQYGRHAYGARYLGVELFGPDRGVEALYNHSSTDMPLVFESLDEAKHWLITQPGITIYRGIYDTWDSRWPRAVDERFGTPDSRAMVSGGKWQSIIGGEPWQTIIGSGPWATIIGGVTQDVRNRAKAIASEKPGHAIGVIHGADGVWRSFAFDSLDDADDWFGSATQERSEYTYAAYFGKLIDGDAYLENESFGGPRPRRKQPGTAIRRGAATTGA